MGSLQDIKQILVIFKPILLLHGKGISSEITLLQLSLPNPLKPGAKSRMKMLQLHLSNQQFY